MPPNCELSSARSSPSSSLLAQTNRISSCRQNSSNSRNRSSLSNSNSSFCFLLLLFCTVQQAEALRRQYEDAGNQRNVMLANEDASYRNDDFNRLKMDLQRKGFENLDFDKQQFIKLLSTNVGRSRYPEPMTRERQRTRPTYSKRDPDPDLSVNLSDMSGLVPDNHDNSGNGSGGGRGGMSLSITNNMDVLRTKLLRELLIRRQSLRHQSWVNRNQQILNSVGKRRRKK